MTIYICNRKRDLTADCTRSRFESPSDSNMLKSSLIVTDEDFAATHSKRNVVSLRSRVILDFDLAPRFPIVS